MRLPTGTQSRELSNNMTPMIDVVFLLIIFFLVSSHLARQESQIPLELPEALTHLPADYQAPALTITIKPDGSWWVAGSQADAGALVDTLTAYRERSGSDALVRVRTDRAVTYDRLEPILRETAKVGLPNVSIAVNQAYPASGGP